MAVREIGEGYELRGHRLKLYPTREQVERFGAMQAEMRRAWNLLVGWRIAHLDACVARAERDGVIGPGPERPEKRLAEDSSDDNRERWRAYEAECRERRRRGIEHCIEGKIAGYGFMRLGVNAWDYQALKQYACPDDDSICSAHQYQALIKNFIKAKRPRPRRLNDSMPLQVMSGRCYERGTPKGATNERGAFLSDATIVFGGMRVRAREPFRRARAERRPDKGLRHPDAPAIEGVAITRETDGWYAAVRLIVPKRQAPGWTIDDAVGIAVGLDTLCATSSGRVFANLRRHESTAEVARRQQRESEAESDEERGIVWKYGDGSHHFMSTWSARLQTRLSRSVRQLIETEIVPYLARYRFIIIAPTSDDDIGEMAQGRQTRLTAERGGYVSAMGLLLSKVRALGSERVREVEWMDCARTCSRCGRVDEKSWAWKPSPFGSCRACGYTERRKINTARNVRAKGLKLLQAEGMSFDGGTTPETS